jgi:hypothetical protein
MQRSPAFTPAGILDRAQMGRAPRRARRVLILILCLLFGVVMVTLAIGLAASL